MTRTEAPNDWGGRLWRNWARTTPELPGFVSPLSLNLRPSLLPVPLIHTVRTGNLTPDHPDVGTPNLTLCPVDESNLLAQVEAMRH